MTVSFRWSLIHPIWCAPELSDQQKAYNIPVVLTHMDRRTFITGTTISFVLLGGCISNGTSDSESSPTDSEATEPASRETSKTTPESPTTQTETVTESPTSTANSTQQANGACRNVRYISFYALSSPGDEDLWGPSTVNVALSLGAGANIYLVVLEDGTVLGRTQVGAPDDGGVEVDGQPIPLDNELSGEHTIRVVAYPNRGEGDQFDAERATPCQHEGGPVQTGPTTIDFSRFSKDIATVTDTESVTKQNNGTSSTQTIGSCPLMHEVVAITTPVSPTGRSMEFEELSSEAKEIFEEARRQDEILFIYDKSRKPPEFGYTDERKSHTIVKDGEKYQLFAYTNAGCSFPAETES